MLSTVVTIGGSATPPTTMDRAGPLLEGVVDVFLDGGIHTVLQVPAGFVAFVLGVAVWRGRRPAAGAGVAAVIGTLGVLASWPLVIETVLVALGGTAIATAALAPSALRRRRGSGRRGGWLSSGLLLALTLVAVLLRPAMDDSRLPWILTTALLVCASAAFLTSRGTPTRRDLVARLVPAGALGILAATATGVVYGHGVAAVALRALLGNGPRNAVPIVLATSLLIAAAVIVMIDAWHDPGPGSSELPRATVVPGAASSEPSHTAGRAR